MLNLGVLLLALVTVVVSSNANGYDGFKLVEVIPKTQQQANFLHELSKIDELYDFFVLRRLPNQPAHVMVHRDEINNFFNKLQQHNLSFRVLCQDVGKSAEANFKLLSSRRNSNLAIIEGRLSTDRYYNHTEINDYLEYLAKHYPSRVIVKIIGKSYMGRDLKTITISNGDGRKNKNVILIDAGIHAREWIAPATSLYVIEQLVENFGENAELLQNYDFVILPVVNPDGYEYTQISAKTRYWRKTRQPYQYKKKVCYGSDPNRNFGCHWKEGGSSSNPCSDQYAGPYAFSEPEAVILRDLIHSLKGRGKFYLTLHSYGNYLVYPWGWTHDLPAAVVEFDEIATVGANAIYNATGTQYKTGTTPAVLYIASGGSHDYAYESGFKISITMELSADSEGYEGFNPHPSRIDSMAKEAWVGIRAMSKKVIDKYSKDPEEL